MRSIYAKALCVLTMFSLLFSVNTFAENQTLIDHRHQAEKPYAIYEGSLELVNGVATFVWKRVPNKDELFYDVLLTSAVDLFLKEFGLLNVGNNNPAAKTVIRDMSKFVTAIPKVLTDVELGSTGIKFDSANLASTFVKPIVKIGFIYHYKSQGYSDEEASQLANYPGDIIARSIQLVGRDRQLMNATNETLKDFIAENMDPNWAVQGVMQAAPKTWMTNSLSDIIKHAKIGDKIVMFVYNAANYVLPFMLVPTLNIRGNARDLTDAGYSRSIAYPLAVFTAYTSTVLVQLFNTYVLATPSRILMDSIGYGWNAVSSTATEYYAYYFPIEVESKD